MTKKKATMSEQEVIARIMHAKPDWSRDQAMSFIEQRVRARLLTPVTGFKEKDRLDFRLWSRLQ